jgi:hypothetical protein
MVVRSVSTRGMVATGVLLLPLLLSACGVARSNQVAAKSSEELSVASDRDICRGLTFNRDNEKLQVEAAKRRLGDCTDATSFVSLGVGAWEVRHMFNAVLS